MTTPAATPTNLTARAAMTATPTKQVTATTSPGAMRVADATNVSEA
ncbi:MAG TPA: hypothetical protein VE172_15600 [Stackebrandtia sp.]|nr:hypothetical protein [Stackebrandtia sp.]HZE40228.1 hypothetical protein [Stackebrandtia sp.]